MYGTSYLNAVTLNNGGVYATDSTTLTTATKNSNNPFAKFTMPEYGLTDYLVTPRDMSLQENQSAITLGASNYRFSNDAWGTVTASSEFASGSGSSGYTTYNYSSKTYNDAWADSYVWIPSNGELDGLWNLTYDDLLSDHGSWGTRSGDYGNYYGYVYCYADSSMPSYSHKLCNSYTAVRPAIHLNLTAIYNAIPVAVDVGELYDSDSSDFNEENYKILLKYLTGDEKATLATATALAETNNNQFASSGYIGTDASVLRSKSLSAGTQGSTSYGAKRANSDIYVRLGGLNWQAMYLSKDKNNNTILTLWLDSNVQDAWTDRMQNEGDYYGFYQGGMFSSFSDGWFSPSWAVGQPNYTSWYPSNMYGTSYLNAVTLNNGGVYATDSTTLTTATKNSNNPFAKFTMSEYGLTDYLVTPRDISWQEEQSSKTILYNDSGNQYYFNESYVTGLSDSEYRVFNGETVITYSLNYTDKAYYDGWADNYLWLPSVSETGRTVSNAGLWNASMSQRMNGDGNVSNPSYIGSKRPYHIGYSYGVYSSVWTRSASNYSYNSGSVIGADCLWEISSDGGSSSGNGSSSWTALAVRPALHLNLSAINTTINNGKVGASVDELYDSDTNSFNEDNYKILLKYLTGNADATIASVTALAETNNNQFASSGYVGTDSRVLASKVLSAGTQGSTAYSAKTSGYLKIRLGGLDWCAMYLSKDKSGNTILTLWLDNNIQEAWVDRENDEGAYYGYINGGLYSMWSAGWSSSTVSTFPSNMYGVSYINAVTLNNGGLYATNVTSSSTAIQSTSIAFALFTMSQYDLTDYLVKPRDVSWQEEQSAKTILSYSYRYPNEAYATGLSNSDFYSSSYNYSNKTYNDAWADNYLWLPSVSETGYNNEYGGLWNTYTYQRQNGDGSSDSSVGSVGTSDCVVSLFHFLRSGYPRSAASAWDLDYGGTTHPLGFVVNSCQAVRPALHLNLSEIDASFGLGATSIEDGEISVSPQRDTYNGSAKTPTIVVTLDDITLTKDTDYKLTYTLNGIIVSELKAVGVYTITATGKKNYKDSLSTTYIIEGGTITATTISPPNECVVFKRSDGAPKIYLQNGSARLVKDADYTITHSIDYVGLTGTATIYGIGNYGGVTIRTYTLVLLDPKAGMYMAIYN